MPSLDAIVTDGDQRSALAVVRSLGRQGIRAAVGSAEENSPASASKYCQASFHYPSPHTNPAGFIQVLEGLARKNVGAVLFPMTDVTVSEVLRNRDRLTPFAIVPFGAGDTYFKSSDKVKLFRLAEKVGVSMPKTLYSDSFPSFEALVAESEGLGYPLVVKPAFSRFRSAQDWRSTTVRYVRDRAELTEVLKGDTFRELPFLIQERIYGPGVGVFLLAQGGEVLVHFAHRRLREKPPSGGVSVLCESVAAPSEALEAAARLLKALHWTGVAMVEFKRDVRDRLPKLMEVNGRFWGSLQLAVSAGVDFPCLLYRLARQEKIEAPDHYQLGLKSRWELGDLDHLLIRMKKSSCALDLAPDAPSRLKVLKDFVWDFFRPSVRWEVFRPEDPVPFLVELKHYFKAFLR